MKAMAIVLGIGIAASHAAAAFDLEGHRGARGRFPENTLPAFAFALGTGVSTLELDTAVTRDGIVVVSHNRRLNPDITRGPDGRWIEPPGAIIRSLDLAELKRHDVGTLRPGTRYAAAFPNQQAVPGTPIPTLAELVELVQRAGNRTVRFNIETKLSPLEPDEALASDAFARTLVAELRRLGIADRSMVQSFDWRTLRIVQAEAPEIPTVYLTLEQGGEANVRRDAPSPWLAGLTLDAAGGSLPRLVKEAGGKVWSPYFGDLAEPALREAQALGLKVVTWTVNRREDMERLIALGVDGIISDYPDLLREVLAQRGIAVPPATPVRGP